MTSTPWRYAGRSGVRVPSPWSVRMTNFRPARAAAAATSSIVPVPSDRRVWMWIAPRAPAGTADVIASGSRAGGSENATTVARMTMSRGDDAS